MANRWPLALLRRWRARPARPAVAARLYRRDGCGLCDEALELLRPFVEAGRLKAELVDIEAEPELFRRYCLTIPVLEIVDGPTLCWPFERADLRRALG